jgi:hypothetical protein
MYILYFVDLHLLVNQTHKHLRLPHQLQSLLSGSVPVKITYFTDKDFIQPRFISSLGELSSHLMCLY